MNAETIISTTSYNDFFLQALKSISTSNFSNEAFNSSSFV